MAYLILQNFDTLEITMKIFFDTCCLFKLSIYTRSISFLTSAKNWGTLIFGSPAPSVSIGTYPRYLQSSGDPKIKVPQFLAEVRKEMERV